MELGELCRFSCWLLHGYLHFLRTGLTGPGDPCLTGVPNVWSDYWRFWQLLVSFCCVPGFQNRRYSIGFVSCGRRTHDRAVRSMMRKGYGLQKKQLTPPRDAVNSQNVFAAGDSCSALSERYYIASLFLLGIIFSSQSLACVVVYTLTILSSDPVISCGYWFQVSSL